ncbi:unnamed protein product [Adineta steineri]|uniref:G-protein coupled receptors family 1 profile domain-containing protein n=1 Tax=Adineta steineri TaxID=433720 RepID=A0A814MPG7_9BILA|nr:unnamed protein product [Adineta steineri]CAF1081763.1 unnamed protein product [Adineta steineri]
MIPNLGLGIGSSMYTLDHVDPNTTILAFCKLRIYLSQVVALTYRWSLTAACIDRYALSSTNARLRNFAKVYVARRVIGVIVIVWLILPVHTLIFYNIRAGACGILYDTGVALYHSIFTTMVSCILPTIIMFSCALLIRRNLARKRQRHQLTVNLQAERRDQQLLVMLFTQVIVYIISVIPLMIIYIYTAVTFNISNKPIERIAIERFAAFTAEAMIYLFPVSSFFLYTMSSRTFRSELKNLLHSTFSCKWLNNTGRIQPITDTSTFKNNTGHLSAVVQIPQSHDPGRIELEHHSEIEEQQEND